MGQQHPKVFVVVLNWNQPEMTSECLCSLAAQDYPNFHVVLVDNGSTDASAATLRAQFGWATIIELEKNIGYSPGNNAGIEYALQNQADYVFLLNNDTEVHSRMLRQLVEAAESDPEIGMAGPTMYYSDPPGMIYSAANYIDWWRGELERRHRGDFDTPGYRGDRIVEVDFVDTCAVLVKRQVIDRIGPMNGDYFINFDDVDWSVRARKAGYKIAYVPSAHMWHKVSATMGIGSPATTYFMTRNALLFFWTHAPGVARIMAVVRITLRMLGHIGAWTLRSKYRTDLYRCKRMASVFGLRDFYARKLGPMSPDAERTCYPK